MNISYFIARAKKKKKKKEMTKKQQQNYRDILDRHYILLFIGNWKYNLFFFHLQLNIIIKEATRVSLWGQTFTISIMTRFWLPAERALFQFSNLSFVERQFIPVQTYLKRREKACLKTIYQNNIFTRALETSAECKTHKPFSWWRIEESGYHKYKHGTINYQF